MKLIELRGKLTRGAGQMWCDNSAYYFDSHENGTFDREEYTARCEREELLDAAITLLDSIINVAEDLGTTSLKRVRELHADFRRAAGECWVDTEMAREDDNVTQDEYDVLADCRDLLFEAFFNVNALLQVLEVLGDDDC